MAEIGNLVWTRKHDNDGHFVANDAPAHAGKEIEDFVAEVWPKAKDASVT